jgi:RNA recognition motif-containing protein
LLRLRGGDTVVSPLHTKRLALKNALLKSKTKGRVLSPEEFLKQQQRPERTLMVTNLHETVDEIELLELFVLGGDVVKVAIPRDPETHQHHGYAYVEFRHTVHAVSALCRFNMVQLSSKPMKIRHLIKGKAAAEFYHPCAKLFVSRLASDITEWDLWWAFQV